MAKQRDEEYHLPTNIIEGRRLGDRADDADAFMPDPEAGRAQIDDDIAETLAQEFVQAATSGQDAGEETLDELVEEELGGPFIVTTGDEEFGLSVDSMNPEDAMREPLPRATAGMVMPSVEEWQAADDDESVSDDDDDDVRR